MRSGYRDAPPKGTRPGQMQVGLACEEVSSMAKCDLPNIHRYTAATSNYVYDASSGEILRVNNAVHDVLGLVGKVQESEIAGQLREKHSVEEVHEALRSVRSAQREQSLLLPSYPERMAPPYNKQAVVELLNSLRHLTLNVTESCNMRCRYCVFSGQYQFNRTHSEKRMAFETGRKAIDLYLQRVDNDRFPTVGFYGGEPLLAFGLMKKWVDYARSTREDTKFNITTNGTLLAGERLQFLVDHDFSVLVSVDGPGQVHDRNRILRNGVIQTTDRKQTREATESFADYCSRKVSIRATHDLRGGIEAIDEFFRDDPVIAKTRTARLGTVDSHDTSYYDRFQRDTRELEIAASRYVDRAVRSGPEARRDLSHQLFGRDFYVIQERATGPFAETVGCAGLCAPGNSRLFVDTEGRYFPCERIETSPSLCIGDVDSGLDAERVWDLMDQYASVIGEDCRRCWAVRLCRMCFVHAVRDGRFDLEKTRENCELQRRRLHLSLVRYSTILESDPEAFDYIKKHIPNDEEEPF